MKKLGLIVIGICLSSYTYANNLPFVGTKSFSFGGVPAIHTTYDINIKSNGLTTLKSTTCYSEHCDKSVKLYQGKYKSVIAFNNKQGGESGHIKLTKKRAYLLDNKKNQVYGCDTVNGGSETDPCVSTYY